ncbi:MAG: hypothetical protein KatS3mg109_0084 [Pirellulaceae bacterium]|nr:MAG: hypothetical protein KatS3mg109_0084 [Pirellulaceae bacterium]
MSNSRLWILGAPDPEMEMIENILHQCGEQIIYATGEDGRRVHPGNAYRCPVPAVPEGATVYAVECIGALPEGWVRIDHHRPGDPGYGKPPAEFLPASSIGQVIAELADIRVGTLYTTLLDALAWAAEQVSDSEAGRAGAVDIDDAPRVGVTHFGRRVVNFHYARGTWWVHVPRGGCEDGGSSDYVAIPPDIVLAAAADHCLAAAYRGECPGVDPDALMRWRVEFRAAFQGRSVDEVLADVEAARRILRD